MFASIARRYDLNNHLHSMGMDRGWRRVAVTMSEVPEGARVLDVACGTGDLSEAFARTPAAEVVGLDFTREMLEVARTRQSTLAPEFARKLTYIEGDAMALPFDDASFDRVSIAFGLRNVSAPEKALSEFKRVLRPGGRLAVLEFDQPRSRIVRWFNDLYCARIMPMTATLISGDKSGAYYYLPRSVQTFMTSDVLRDALARAGFADARTRRLSLGICACTVADNPRIA